MAATLPERALAQAGAVLPAQSLPQPLSPTTPPASGGSAAQPDGATETAALPEQDDGPPEAVAAPAPEEKTPEQQAADEAADAALAAQPIDESQFTLDLDESLDVGVAWPDLDAKPTPPPEAAAAAPGAPDASVGGAAPTGGAAAQDGGTGATVPAPGAASGPAPGATAGSPPAPEPASDAGTASDDAASADEPVESVPLADDGALHRYAVEMTGLDAIADSQFEARFDGASMLKAEIGKPANIAQINRRMRQDSDLIERILDAKGYYDAIIRSSVRPAPAGGDRLRVQFSVRPGPRYALRRVSLPGLAAATAHVPSLATVFPVKVGDPVDADAILSGRQSLETALDENGFPFSSVAEPSVTIDHETQKGDLELVVRSGGYRLFGGLVLDEGAAKLFTGRHLQRMARFGKGDVYKASEVEDLRRALVATGLVSSAIVKPQDAGDGQHADIAVSTAPAPPRTIAGQIGYGTGEGYQVEASWQHRNFFPPEGALKLSGLVGTKEQSAGVSVRRNNYPRRDHVLTGSLSFQHQNYDAYQAQTIDLGIGLERQTNILFQKRWVWSAGAELIATREHGVFSSSLAQSTRDYLIVAVPLSVTYDGSDDLLDPTRGFRLGARVSPEIAQQSGVVYSYMKTQVDGSLYWPLSERIVLASRVRLGSILGGVDSYNIAPSRRFYAGGGASVRGYGYQAIGPQDSSGDPVGGKSLAEFSVEARVRFGAFGLVPFFDAGNIATGFLPRLNAVRYGAGLGMRYYSTFGPIRIDVGTPLNRQAGESRIAVYVSLGQAF